MNQIIYLVSSPVVNCIKIGYWSNHDIRTLVSRYRTYYGYKLELYYFYCNNAIDIENKIHLHFQKYNFNLELFNKTYLNEYLQYIKNLGYKIIDYKTIKKSKKSKSHNKSIILIYNNMYDVKLKNISSIKNITPNINLINIFYDNNQIKIIENKIINSIYISYNEYCILIFNYICKMLNLKIINNKFVINQKILKLLRQHFNNEINLLYALNNNIIIKNNIYINLINSNNNNQKNYLNKLKVIFKIKNICKITNINEFILDYDNRQKLFKHMNDSNNHLLYYQKLYDLFKIQNKNNKFNDNKLVRLVKKIFNDVFLFDFKPSTERIKVNDVKKRVRIYKANPPFYFKNV